MGYQKQRYVSLPKLKGNFVCFAKFLQNHWYFYFKIVVMLHNWSGIQMDTDCYTDIINELFGQLC